MSLPMTLQKDYDEAMAKYEKSMDGNEDEGIVLDDSDADEINLDKPEQKVVDPNEGNTMDGDPPLESDNDDGDDGDDDDSDELSSKDENTHAEEIKSEPDHAEETWQKRYEILTGKYNAEIPRLHKEVKRLNQQIDLLQGVLERGGNQPQAKVNTNTPEMVSSSDVDLTKYLDEETIEEYGEDFWKKALELSDRIAEEKVSKVRSNVEHASHDSFVSQLKNEISNFDSINDDPLFNDWLENTPDGFSGRPIAAALDDAVGKRDTVTIKKIFNSWTGNNGMPTGFSTKPDLSRQIAPKKTQVTKSPGTSSGRIYTSEDLAIISNDINRGAYSQKETKALMKEIDKAYKEGRIR